MTRTDVKALIRNGEGSLVEFKLDSVYNYDLAKEIVAFTNSAGGTILLGVADDGSIRGTAIDRVAYPSAVLREVIVNALVHRDYSVYGTDITLSLYADRMEIRSPGRLPNTVTVEAMKFGFRYARNQTLVNVMRDYRSVDFRGTGIRNKIIPGMFQHNGTEPEFMVTDWDFTVRLWKEHEPRPEPV